MDLGSMKQQQPTNVSATFIIFSGTAHAIHSDLRVTLHGQSTNNGWSRHDCLPRWLLPAAPTTSHHSVTDAHTRSDDCPGLHQLSTKLLQFVALWNCRQSTKATTVRPEGGSTSDHWYAWRTEHITPVLQSLRWLPVRQRILFKLVVLVHKCLSGHALAYLADDCRLIRRRRSDLRSSSSTTKLEVPPTRTTFGDRSFAVDRPRVLTVYRRSFATHRCHSLFSPTNSRLICLDNSCGVCDLE